MCSLLAQIVIWPVHTEVSEILPGIGEIYADSFPSSLEDRNESLALIKRSLLLNDSPSSSNTNSGQGSGGNGGGGGSGGGGGGAYRADIQKYYYPFIIAARIGPYTFS